MTDSEFKAMSDDALGERFRSLIGAYNQACMAYDHAKSAEIHRDFYTVEDELRSRRGDNWRRTGLEAMSLEEVIERFKERAVAYDGADGSDETEHLYRELKDAKDELQRRPGDQRRALFALYKHPDIRVRHAAAQATRTLAPLLSRHRQLNIDDDNWAPPASGLDIEQAGIKAMFPTRAQQPDRLAALSPKELTQRFLDLALEQYQAALGGEIAKYNRLYDQIAAIEQEFKNRPDDQRAALVPFLAHANPQVRLMAAQSTLAVSPVAARQTLQEISDQNEYPQAAYARGTLRALERGDRKLT